ncbi:transporter [Paenibacillus sp. IB182496]|uniref:Transporter n=1 Tax=Paenibacillus sabuli TaxID=2772509 RepID=A0A927BNI5_9BACL|nr:transporter [Paenibacillus sabuli]MBD2843808.1 transporter [Paenibacillus sabuli]
MQKIARTAYEGLMIVLVMVTIVTLWTDSAYNNAINWAVWFIFVVDFIVRLVKADSRWAFVRRHPFLVIAIIPFDQFFQVARIVRLIYLFRIKTITKYYISPYVDKLTDRSRTLIVLGLLGILLTEALLIWQVEPSMTSYADALEAVAGYLLFFGHQLYAIESATAMWALTCTSVLGIVVQGLALQWLFAQAERLRQRWRGDGTSAAAEASATTEEKASR